MASKDNGGSGGKWDVKASRVSKRTMNPIRAIVDTMKLDPNKDKPTISLSIGDPTKFGNLPVAAPVLEAVQEAVQAGNSNGYPPSIGYPSAREAVAKSYTQEAAPVAANDVVLASGCSGALDLAMGALCDEGSNVLLPAPGFSLYNTLAKSKGVEARSYRLLPDRQWEADLEHMTSLIDSKTAAIVVTNPSNPCGSVYSREHLESILAVAERHCVPIIADEIYRGMVFSGETHHDLAPLTKTVPILSCGGIAKRFVVPGWRLGWVVIHDRQGIFGDEIRGALVRLSQLILGPNSIIQAALPKMLAETPSSYFDGIMAQLEANAKLCYEKLSAIPELRPVMPKGAMYMLVEVLVERFVDIPNDRRFTEMLMGEESVFCLPAEVFEAPGFFRIVTSVPHDKMVAAVERIALFCDRHSKKRKAAATEGNGNHIQKQARKG